MKAIWMHAADLEGRDPEAVVEEILGLGLDTAAIAFAYHGGRLLTPRHPRRRVLELDPSSVYFRSDPGRYQGLRLQPRVARAAALMDPFLAACGRAGLAVNAWTVVCHNDRLGFELPDCCVRNVFGDVYPYALCPSRPDVRAYAAALCGEIADVGQVSRIELEAVSFLGLEHGSLHDKRGIRLAPLALWLLSVCLCAACRERVGAALEDFSPIALDWLERYFKTLDPRAPDDLREALEVVLGAELLDELVAARRAVVASLIDEIRQATRGLHLNVRLAPDPLFIGGKSALDWSDLPGRVDSATVTFFGYPVERMREELEGLPGGRERPVPVYGGFVFHAPDCGSESEVRQRADLLREAEVDGLSLYAYTLAGQVQLRWLPPALRGPPSSRA